ncbi:putative malate:quinone oxidoreductase [Dissostichus eleginoides]|uniref:Malate:quinone oxidoreductase n=1 Tax=Dissostichus eleginoides TaxID=100907 RepID=A0AAD9F788_DISEL|nr:putative malate:quinone oxidoreductase [Dissostichus eleginoides]
MVILDVLIIGGGPHALTLATLLSHPDPDPNLTLDMSHPSPSPSPSRTLRGLRKTQRHPTTNAAEARRRRGHQQA